MTENDNGDDQRMTTRNNTAIEGGGYGVGDFGTLIRMGEALVPTGFLPQHLRTAGQVAAIILAGRELGMQPMRALRCLRMIKGNVVEAADSQLARFKTDGGRASFRSLTEHEAVLWLRHPNGDEHTETFTAADAKSAGLGTNENWRKFPKAMLRSRAITAGLKSLGWEGGVGAYGPDELVDHVDVVDQPPVVEAPRKEIAAPVGDRPQPGPTASAKEEAYALLRKLRSMIGAVTTSEEIAENYDLWLDLPGVSSMPDAGLRLAEAYKTGLVRTVVGGSLSADLAVAVSKIDNL